MWSPIVVFFLVGFAFAANNPCWKDGQEYVYRIQGRSLASLKEISNQQSGFFFKATLRLQPQSDRKIRAQISNPEYADFHSDLPVWVAPIDEEPLSWKPLKMSGKPFEVEMEESRITGLIISKDTPVWEANMIKSIMSQFQLNTNGANLINKKLNTLPENGDYDNDAVFTAMEDTVTGNTETLYQIRPLPDHVLQADPREAQYLDAPEGGDVIEVLKHKNYTNNVELPSYSFGFEGLTYGRPATNQMGSFFSRESTSRIILTGSLKQFVIRKSITFNKLHVSPTLSEEKTGVVSTMVNATLEKITSQDKQISEVPQPKRVGNLVYSYEEPYSQSNEVQAKPEYQWRQEDDSNQYGQDDDYRNNIIRSPRSIRSQYSDNEQGYKQDLSDLKDAPESPLLPYTMGFEGMSIKNKIDVVEEVKKLAKEIGKRMQQSDKDHHEQLLDMYTSMVSLIRIMDEQEIQEAAKELYTNSEHGLERAIWASFRDGVADSGTGPSLLVIKEWIKTDKISGREASNVVVSMCSSVRQPTPEYFRRMFELVKEPKVQKQWPLNDTILMGYADIIRRVYVDQKERKERFPVKSFKPLRSEEGKQFIEKEVMSYLKQELNEAIERSETHKIHALIRTLGNTGSYEILPIFEPYLEGKRQCSQFQRVLMILAMDQMVLTHPETAQDVLFRTYQNPAETREVRIAAVFQLMRTRPSADLLQVMAQYTHIDQDDYVNAVVKSSIETAADLDDGECSSFSPLKKAAQHAKSLLTEKVFGLRYGGNYLRSYVVEELQKTYKQVTQVFGSDDAVSPKGIRFTLRQYQGGIQTRLAHIQALLSSVDDLLQVGNEQTEKYHKQEQQQREHSQEQEQNPWSSQNIAKLLKIDPEDQEQLEGFLLMELSEYRNMFSFDNRTLEQLVEEIRHLEEEFKKVNEISIYKLTTTERALSIPTEMGVPFLFTYDIPKLIKAQGKFSFSAQPQLSQNGKIQTPEQIELKADMDVTVSRKVQGRLSVTAPFNHKQYFAGFDKHMEINVPARIEAQIDVKNMDAGIEVELKPKKEHKLFHYGSLPYTSKVDVTSFKAMSAEQDTKEIRQRDLQAFDSTYGKESTGMAFRVEIVHPRKSLNMFNLYRMTAPRLHYITDVLDTIWDDDTVQFSLLNVNYNPQKSSARKVDIRLSYEQKYKSQSDSGSSSEWILNANADSSQRQEELMKKIATDIKNVEVQSIDSTVEFKGDEKIKYIFTGAIARSDVDAKSRIMFSYKRSSNGSPKPHELHLVAKSYIPNTNALDMEYTMKNEPMADTEIKVKFGNSEESLSKIEAQWQFRRSEERKEYLTSLPMHKQCKDEMKSGNKQLPACLNMTMMGNLLDNINLKIHHENLKPEFIEVVERYFRLAQAEAHPSLQTIYKDMSMDENEIKMQARFHPDLQAVNITVKSPRQETKFTDIEICPMSQQIFVLHPVFNLRTRLSQQIFAEMDTYRASCVVDKTHINTFSNLTYPADISKHWTVLLQYLRGNSQRHQQSIQEQLRSQPDNYVVLVRENQEAANKKDIKIVFSAPESDYKVVEIEMTPSQGSSDPKAKVTVDGKEIQLSEKESHDIKGRLAQIYLLPNGEVKCEVNREFYIIYDGNRARISTSHGKFQKSIAGLCGEFSYQESDDMTTPQACVARDPEEFVKSYEVEGQKGQQLRELFKGKTNKCVEKEIPLYVDVITARDYRVKQESEQSSRCTLFQTKYVQENGQTCFTLRAQPTCSKQCQPRNRITKNVPVHCVKQNSKVADLWKQQIDNGSSPDFSSQKQHKVVKMTVPESCSK